MQYFKTSCLLFGLFTIITGLIYPISVTLLNNLIFPWQANGSIIYVNNKSIGSALVGQEFTSSKYFAGRPSATKTFPYNGLAASGSNLGPTNPKLYNLVTNRIKSLQEINFKPQQSVPKDLVFASASGIDPDISLEAALYQSQRIAQERTLNPNIINKLIYANLTPKTGFILGEARLNVLRLNLALDKLGEQNA